jgi:hypothetical protein
VKPQEVVPSRICRTVHGCVHAAAVRPWGKDLPWAWPRDGRRETLEGAGIALAKQYEAQGLNMLWTHAQFEDKSISVEAGLMDMLDRMQTGRFKVFKHLHDWFEEFRLYHRRGGKVFKEGDDLMSATRYALDAALRGDCAPGGQEAIWASPPGRWVDGVTDHKQRRLQMDEQQLSAEQHWDDLAERNPGLASAFAAALGRVGIPSGNNRPPRWPTGNA